MSFEVREPATVHVARPIPRRYVALGLIVVVIVLLGALIAIRGNKPQSNTAAVETFTPAPASVMTPLTSLPTATINAVGASTPASGAIAPLKATGSTSVWQAGSHNVAGRPVVFFYGSEFAPYAAAERWPVIAALSRFGTFTSVGLMQSSNSIAFSNTPTFTFSATKYSSVWIDLQTVERYSALNPTGARYTSLQIPTATQAAALSVYDGQSTIPMLDIANRYVLVGSSFSPGVLGSQSQSQIVSDLAIPTSPITESIVASANQITAAICTLTGQRPTAVCHARGVVAAGAKLPPTPGAGVGVRAGVTPTTQAKASSS